MWFCNDVVYLEIDAIVWEVLLACGVGMNFWPFDSISTKAPCRKREDKFKIDLGSCLFGR